MKILVTGAAGFIGSALTKALLARGNEVVGLDNINDYYDVSLKEARLALLKLYPNYTHVHLDLSDRVAIAALFAQSRPQRVVNLAAQAGVRYSIDNPLAYMDSNVVGFANVLEGCRHQGVEHLVYASSSSVYGANTAKPFSVHHSVDHPLSLYAASKKANELMAHTYSHLFNLPTTGLRFFTVYGPWGRPDMAITKFAKAICQGQTIDVYNYGQHLRDFTYIDDVVDALLLALDNPAQANTAWLSDQPDAATSNAPWRIYNIGSNKPVPLLDCIATLEKALGRSATKNFMPIQPGDVPETYADVKDTMDALGFYPRTTIEVGIEKFVSWYLNYYKEKK